MLVVCDRILHSVRLTTINIETLEKQTEEAEDFLAIAGIWENREITSETLRQEAWKEQYK